MRYIKLVMLVLMLLVLSCGNMDTNKVQDGAGAGKKEFTDAASAAAAAKEDMLNAMSSVDFGVDKEKLRSSAPGASVMKYDLDWNSILNADSATKPESIAGNEAVTIVPLVNGSDVVTVVSLMGGNGKYGIGAIGDKQIATELDMVKKAAGQAEVRIYQVPNLDAMVYATGKDTATMYYTAYNGNSIRQPMTAASLMRMLRADAETFMRVNGDAMKKGRLVK